MSLLLALALLAGSPVRPATQTTPVLPPAPVVAPTDDDAVDDSPPAVTGHCRTDVASPQQASPPRTFQATRILGLVFRTRLGEGADPSRVRVRLYTPRGELYQVLTPAPIAPTEADRRAARRRPARWLEAEVPVAGSQILWSSFYGRWTAVTSLDGDRAPCGPPLRFVIRP